MKPKASESEVFDFLTFVSVNDIDKNNRVFTIKILTLALVREKLFTVLKLIIMVQSLPSRWLPRSHKSRP